MNQPRTGVSLLLALSAGAIALPATAEVRDFECTPIEVAVTLDRIHVSCTAPAVLSIRPLERNREVRYFAYPMLPQSPQVLLGNQVKLLEYYLDLFQTALVHRRKLRISFETDFTRSRLYGCHPSDCREIVAAAMLDEPVDETGESTIDGDDEGSQ